MFDESSQNVCKNKYVFETLTKIPCLIHWYYDISNSLNR